MRRSCPHKRPNRRQILARKEAEFSRERTEAQRSISASSEAAAVANERAGMLTRRVKELNDELEREENNEYETVG